MIHRSLLLPTDYMQIVFHCFAAQKAGKMQFLIVEMLVFAQAYSLPSYDSVHSFSEYRIAGTL